jgi:hypothetical protein
MGTSRRRVPRILARHRSSSCRCHFFPVEVVVGVIVVVAANANTAAQGRWGCRLAIVVAVLRLVVAVVVLVSAIAIAWDDKNELPVVRPPPPGTIFLWGERQATYRPQKMRLARNDVILHARY